MINSSFILHPPPLTIREFLQRNVGGWVVAWLWCPLTVRLTSGCGEVIDWVVLGPLKTLSEALEVRGRLLCKSASFCTVATLGERCHIPPPLLSSPLSPTAPLPLVFTLGKWGRRQLNLFSLSLHFSPSSEVAPLKKANSLG